MLTGMHKSVSTEQDEFFGYLQLQGSIAAPSTSNTHDATLPGGLLLLCHKVICVKQQNGHQYDRWFQHCAESGKEPRRGSPSVIGTIAFCGQHSW
jgi:hypothetical protein